MTPVECKELWEHWERCKPWLEAALVYSHGTHTIADVQRQVEMGFLQFWPGQKCAVVTEIIEYPRLTALSYFLAGGNGWELLNVMEPMIVSWARDKGCTRVYETGRRGWERVLDRLGYKRQWSVMVKDI